jgi:hypothetical protein
MGVSVRETKPETRIATPIVTANSWNSRPTMPPRKSTGMNTAVNDSVIDTMVKPISRAPSSAACIGRFPISMWRTMFSSITMASSTTNPTDSVSAISERLSRLYPNSHIAANVPTIDNGSARLGITVAERLRRNRKMTRTTRPSVMSRVSFTSWTESRIPCERSYSVCTRTDVGSCGPRAATVRDTASATATVLVPGCRCTASMMARAPSNQLAVLLSCTSSSTRATSCSRTGAPLR